MGLHVTLQSPPHLLAMASLIPMAVPPVDACRLRAATQPRRRAQHCTAHRLGGLLRRGCRNEPRNNYPRLKKQTIWGWRITHLCYCFDSLYELKNWTTKCRCMSLHVLLFQGKELKRTSKYVELCWLFGGSKSSREKT